jgi:hypothetical protein
MNRATRVSLLLMAVAVPIMSGFHPLAAQAPANDACRLVTGAEFESLLSGKATPQSVSLGEVQTCSARTQTTSATVRLFKRTGDPSGAREQAGIDALKKMGGQVEVKTSGGITCVTAIPPADKVQMGFGTSCTVTNKAPMFAVIEVRATSQKDMVPMEKLRAVAEKMAGRM